MSHDNDDEILINVEDAESVSCNGCEVSYMIVLDEDFLQASVQYCSYCGELLM